MVANESSSSTILLASFETSVPAMPIARPTSAFFKAGASLAPSPVTATTSPISCKSLTMRYLSNGLARARTRRPGSRRLSSSSSSWLNFGLVRTTESGVSTGSSGRLIRPVLYAMARAVSTLSPVIIFTSMPAAWQRARASLTSSRNGSWIATKPTKTRLFSSASECSVHLASEPPRFGDRIA